MKALVGAGISVYTAFMAFGSVRILPELALHPVMWAIPVAVGIALILWHWRIIDRQVRAQRRPPLHNGLNGRRLRRKIRHDLRRGDHARQACARVRARADQIEAVDLLALVVRPEPRALEQLRLEGKRRALLRQAACL